MKKKLNSKWKYGMTVVLGGSLLGLAVLGFNVSLRPDYSVSEKRELKHFPKMSLAAVWSGDWFTELTDWFSDTFPLRETLLSGEASLEQLYGLQGEAIYSRSDSVAESIPETAAALAPTFSFDDLTAAEGGDAAEASTVSSGSAEEENAESAAAPESSAIPESSATPESAAALESAAAFETDAEGNLQIEKQDTEGVDLTGEQAGNIYVTDGRAYEIYYFSQKNVTAYASMINTVEAMLPENVTLYDMLIPNSFGVQLPENVQAKLGSSGMNEAFAYTYSLIDPAVKRVSVFDTLREHKDEYIYFRTDHHWTQLGAYYAYRRFCEEKGITPHELSAYESVNYDGFYGTFYFSTNRAETLKQNPDTITAYIPLCGNSMSYRDSAGTMQEAAIINDASKMNAGNRYNCFLLGDNAYTEIQNPNLTDGSACVLVKESYGNALAPFLADHYQNLYVIDYRYYQGNLLDFIREKGVQDVVFANNVMAVGQKASGQMMALFN